ncbi:hypothetical protein KRE40_07775 [Elizabethkingia meningoseptica]|uniref:hypothetical protein n=1 Tax=Elizabethkingia meningoseptica TaxID=238 RepID=UPI0023B13AF1|nr:hypothetical protein [Elizabethkingia meningoseptica]MDE5438005.1 hypothetical protein [Elizabethkingia meningoseptica]MDE5508548.1 hypothetical protein [Elizabethkingia meningoseptica]MDE5516092.1 hypothetical protein [Elizabethkingia meningoseptica]MDE5526931.1 hypothetical protein [Elizabethkingia meningoseptica]MDE5531770.1 hypothetical protein [Elizabethkingia meningoseptica]
MNYTEEQIFIRAKKVLKDLQQQYFKEENIEKAWFNDKNEVARPRGTIMPTWTIAVNEPIFETSEFLIFSDDTGEPLYYQNANMIIHEIQKDDNGNYY